MMQVNLDGLKAFLGEAAFQRWLDARDYPKTELQCQHNRIRYAIIPRHPQDAIQEEAFAQAVYTQVLFDWQNPRGIERMSIGSVSVQFKDQPDLCPEAKAILMNAGLLYRGVAC